MTRALFNSDRQEKRRKTKQNKTIEDDQLIKSGSSKTQWDIRHMLLTRADESRG